MATHDAVDRTICLTGPESTGKTTLARALSERLGAPVVPEVARAYFEGRAARKGLDVREGYVRDDLLEIARLQREAEHAARVAHRGLLICDTDVLVLRIWWREKYGPLPQPLIDGPPYPGARAYLLLAPDVPWQSDPLRENPVDRDRLYVLHVRALSEAGLPYRVVTGAGAERVASALRQLRSLFDEG
jgi:nicotinamide riboside kinase